MALDISKVSFKETLNNYNGKTSGSKFIGVISSLVCLGLFVMLVVFYFFNQGEATNVLALIDKTTTYFTVSAGLMGVKSVTSAFGKNHIILSNEKTSKKKKKKAEDEELEDINQEQDAEE